MPQPTDATLLNSHRAAALAIGGALAARRQHPDAPEVWRAAQRRAIAAVETACQGRDLELCLRAGAVLVCDEQVLTFAPDDRPFGQLRSAGIGAIVLHADPADAVVEHFLALLAELQSCRDADAELATLLDASRLPGVELRAAADLPRANADQTADWNNLPPPLEASPQLRASIERDLCSNLPALAARQLLDDGAADADAGDARHRARTEREVVLRLLDRLLDADDVSTVSWLLTELERQAEPDQELCRRAADRVRGRLDDAWLDRTLERGTAEEAMQLSALVLQLGGDCAARFAIAAAARAHPMAQLLGDLLGTPATGPASQPGDA